MDINLPPDIETTKEYNFDFYFAKSLKEKSANKESSSDEEES